jgi:hypothetical protein
MWFTPSGIYPKGARTAVPLSLITADEVGVLNVQRYKRGIGVMRRRVYRYAERVFVEKGLSLCGEGVCSKGLSLCGEGLLQGFTAMRKGFAPGVYRNAERVTAMRKGLPLCGEGLLQGFTAMRKGLPLCGKGYRYAERVTAMRRGFAPGVYRNAERVTAMRRGFA